MYTHAYTICIPMCIFFCFSVVKSCLTPTLHPVGCSMPGFPVLRSLSELAQIHVL